MQKSRFYGCSTLLLIALALLVAPGTRAGAGNAPRLVELFTSQGCSSCPPAEAVLGELAHDDKIVALAFHVDYWDSIGWRDTFSVPIAVQRQSRYVTTLGLSSAFTPQAVIDGRTSLVGSDRQRLKGSTGRDSESIPILLSVANGELIIVLPQGGGSDVYDVNVAAYLSEATTAVGRGENSGKTLREFNIVRSLQRVASWQGRADRVRVPLASLPRDADRVAVFLQRVNQGPVAGVAAVAL